MNELITLKTSEGGERTVSGRELHEFLEVDTRFNDWITNKIKEYGFIKGTDYDSFTENLVKGGRPRVEYELTLNMAKELSMLEKNEKGKEARKYFIKCEKQLETLKTQVFLNKIEDFQNSLEEAKRQFKPSHSKKLQYNKLIKQLSYTDDEFVAIQTFVFAMLGVDKWENTAVEDGPRIMELINTPAALISSKQFQQTKLY